MNTEDTSSDFVIVWEPPKLEAPEFRLYYDDTGAVICYTGDKSIEGNYIIIDAHTFAAGRPDVRVIDGRISNVAPNAVVYKLMPDKTEGKDCHTEDISVLVDESYIGKKQKWKLNIYEL